MLETLDDATSGGALGTDATVVQQRSLVEALETMQANPHCWLIPTAS